MGKLKNLEIKCADVFRNEDSLLSYEENNKYYMVKDLNEDLIIIPKSIVTNSSVFRVLLEDLGFEGPFFKLNYQGCELTLNLRLRNIENLQYRFLEAIIYSFYFSIDQLRLPSKLTDALYVPLCHSLFNIIKSNKITFSNNYNKYRDVLFTIPNKIKISSNTYKVTMCKELDANGEKVFGLFCNSLSPNFGIYIATEYNEKNISYSNSCISFIHEIVHAIFYETGEDYRFEGGKKDRDFEETLCDFFAYRICEFLRNNDIEIKFN